MHFRHKNSNIPIELFRSFVAISEHGSFSNAAEELNLTQPAISAQVKRLQQLVGGDLFVNKARGVGLSELGLTVESYARRILTLNDQVFALAGRGPKHETIHLGIQAIFVRKVLEDVLNRVPILSTRHYRFTCGSSSNMAENLKSGYLDMVVMLALTESRHNLLADWNEKLVWLRAPNHFPLVDDEPIPLIIRENGFIDRKVMEVLDNHDVPYRIVFSAWEAGTLAAAVEAGIGIMVAPERTIPRSLVIAQDPILPELPELRAGVFFKEGFDLKRNRSIVEAFVSAVQPPPVTPNRPARRAITPTIAHLPVTG